MLMLYCVGLMNKMVALLENSRERKTIIEQISSVKAQIDTTRQFRTERSMWMELFFVTSFQSNLVTKDTLRSAVRTITTATSHHMDLGMINGKS